jgi:hypothetical protein
MRMMTVFVVQLCLTHAMAVQFVLFKPVKQFVFLNRFVSTVCLLVIYLWWTVKRVKCLDPAANSLNWNTSNELSQAAMAAVGLFSLVGMAAICCTPFLAPLVDNGTWNITWRLAANQSVRRHRQTDRQTDTHTNSSPLVPVCAYSMEMLHNEYDFLNENLTYI